MRSGGGAYRLCAGLFRQGLHEGTGDRDCLLALYEALQADKGKKLQAAFDLLTSEEAWTGTGKVEVLQ